MKPTLFAVVSLGIGIAIGLAITRQEFARETLPLTAPSASPAVAAGPKIGTGPKLTVVNGERHDFGTMNRNAAGEHTFVVRNDGDAELVLKKGNPTCKCTSFELDKDRLAPGESTSVHLQWKTLTSDVRFEQSAPLIVDNDPDKTTIALVIEGRVIDVVRPERWDIVLTDISANEPAHARLKIFSYKDKELAIAKQEWLNPQQADHFDARFEPLTPEEISQEAGAAGGLALLLDVRPGLPLGTIDETLRLTTSAAGVEPLEIRLRGSVATDISLAGPRVVPEKLLVNLGQLKPADGIKTTVYLLIKGPYREETTLQITGVEPASELTAKLGEPQRDNPRIVRYPVALSLPPGLSPVARAGDGSYALVKIATTHPQTKELTLKVRYIVTQ
ncbi:MAG: DUF1573 domain-containing protein [Pirellulaceae bacterium]|nr:DUF1573 domain-containing protein [Pirellulaceae bacterium]